jgi:hypothetical protein
VAGLERDVFFVGRLAEYRYYNMDQVVARALMMSEKIISSYGVPVRVGPKPRFVPEPSGQSL